MPEEAWGGDVHLPRWLRKLVHRPEAPGDTPERLREAGKPQPQPQPSVLENSNRAFSGALVDLYNESRNRASPRGDKR